MKKILGRIKIGRLKNLIATAMLRDLRDMFKSWNSNGLKHVSKLGEGKC